MNTEFASAFTAGIPMDRLQQQVPAAFADRAHPDVSSRYVFISTVQLIEALMDAGFQPVNARQTNARDERAQFTRHMIRFRHARESLSLREVVPEVILINAHDATSFYQLRAGLYRPLCTNGLIARIGDFGVIHVPHRGNIIQNVVDGALSIMRGFSTVGEVIERMAVTMLSDDAKLNFSEAAARLRYGCLGHIPYRPSRLLEARRTVDAGNDVWHVYNVVQEAIMRGGVVGMSASGRAGRTRGIRAIREDVRLNTGLWNLAVNLLRE
jgi:hypothetical protein